MEPKLQQWTHWTDTLSPNLEDNPLSVAFPFLCLRSARLVSRRQSDIYSVTEKAKRQWPDDPHRGDDAEFGREEKTCRHNSIYTWPDTGLFKWFPLCYDCAHSGWKRTSNQYHRYLFCDWRGKRDIGRTILNEAMMPNPAEKRKPVASIRFTSGQTRDFIRYFAALRMPSFMSQPHGKIIRC